MADEHQPAAFPAGPFIELNDEQVTAEALTAQIAARLQSRPVLSPPEIPPYAVHEGPPGLPADIPYRFGLYYHLQRTHDLYPRAETAPVLAASPATRLPLFGRLWALIREQAHSLVLFYVNRSLAQQTAVNRHLVGAVSELTRQVEEQQRTIARLERRLQELEQEDES